jgi:hypothetical protein
MKDTENKKYSPEQAAKKILDTLAKASKDHAKARKAAKKVIEDIEDPDMKANKISSDELPATETSVMNKAKVDEGKSPDKKKLGS